MARFWEENSDPTDSVCVLERKRWFVLQTRSQQERVVAGLLHARGTECFLPTSTRRTRTARGPGSREVPLFPGYVFLRGERQDAYVADRNRRLVQIIDVADQDQLERELVQIQRALDAGVGLEPHRRFVAGTPVRVRAGGLLGVQGIVERHAAPHRLILQVQTLGQAVSFELDDDDLEPID
ncbi:MAG: transcription termination/antitermination NusG family protein [Planctomycetota bacterium]